MPYSMLAKEQNLKPKSPPAPGVPYRGSAARQNEVGLAARVAMLRARSGASILHCDRDALHAAASPFTTVQKKRIIHTVGDAQARFSRMKSTSKKRTPSIVNLTVKRLYLTQREIERLMDCARKRGRYGHRDSTMILVAYRHGLRASEVCDLRWQQIELSEGRLHVHHVKSGIPSVHPIRGDEMRALRKLRRDYPRDAHVFVSERGGPINHRFPPARPAPRGSRRDAIPGPPAHASPCLCVQACQRRPRHAGPAALPRAQEHPAHRQVHRNGARPFQGLLALTAVGAGKLGIASPSITLAFAAASRLAIISLISSIPRLICSVVIAFTPPDCSTFISRGTNETSNFKNIAGLFFITLSMAFAPPRRKALCSSAMVSALSALRARSGLPPGFPENPGANLPLMRPLMTLGAVFGSVSAFIVFAWF